MVVAHRDKRVLEEQYLAQVIAVSDLLVLWICYGHPLQQVCCDSAPCGHVAGLLLWFVEG
jgi:hypothetical protein